MVYVEHVAAFAPAVSAGRLCDWNTAVATALGLLPAWEELRRTLAPVPASAGEPTAYLAIQVEWFDVETDEYVLSSWTKEDASSSAVPGFAHYRCTGEELESAVAEVIADGEDTLASLDIQVQVEFLLEIRSDARRRSSPSAATAARTQRRTPSRTRTRLHGSSRRLVGGRKAVRCGR